MIRYRKYDHAYKYELAEDLVFRASEWPTLKKLIRAALDNGWGGWPIETEFISFARGGILTIRAGYAWDGASGPVIDTPSTMSGSVVHDALYQLLRMKLLPNKCRIPSDKLFGAICRKAGMGWWRARRLVRGLRYVGGPAARPKKRDSEEILEAP